MYRAGGMSRRLDAAQGTTPARARAIMNLSKDTRRDLRPSLWDRAMDALRRDWDQTKRDLHLGPSEIVRVSGHARPSWGSPAHHRHESESARSR
jgi:hypothetical protein